MPRPVNVTEEEFLEYLDAQIEFAEASSRLGAAQRIVKECWWFPQPDTLFIMAKEYVARYSKPSATNQTDTEA